MQQPQQSGTQQPIIVLNGGGNERKSEPQMPVIVMPPQPQERNMGIPSEIKLVMNEPRRDYERYERRDYPYPPYPPYYPPQPNPYPPYAPYYPPQANPYPPYPPQPYAAPRVEQPIEVQKPQPQIIVQSAPAPQQAQAPVQQPMIPQNGVMTTTTTTTIDTTQSGKDGKQIDYGSEYRYGGIYDKVNGKN